MDLPIHSPVFLIETDKIKPNPYQPRRIFDEEELKELANSIREFGILQPLVVTKIEQETETGTAVEYQLIAGERRLLAAKLLGLERVPAIVKSINLERERLEMAIIENIQRADLNPIETARAYAKLQDQFGLTQREVSTRVGKSREVVANTLRLLNLPSNIQDAISKKIISESQGRLLLTISDLIHQQTLFEDILKNNLTVRQIKEKVQKIKDITKEPEAIPLDSIAIDPETQILEKELEEFFGTKVRLEKSGDPPTGGGKITIAFYSPEELQGIVAKLLKIEEAKQDDNLSLQSL
jgi:ParB family chromosome partitioning protein